MENQDLKNIIGTPAGLALAILQGLYQAFGGTQENPEEETEGDETEEEGTDTGDQEGEETAQETPTAPEETETEGENEPTEGTEETEEEGTEEEGETETGEEDRDTLGETPEGTNDPAEKPEGEEEGKEAGEEAPDQDTEGETGSEDAGEDLSEGEGESQDKEGTEGEGDPTGEDEGDGGEATPGDQEGEGETDPETEGAEGDGGDQEGSEGENDQETDQAEVQTGTPGNPRETLSQALETEGTNLAPQSLGYCYPDDKYTRRAMEYLSAWDTVGDLRKYPAVTNTGNTRTGYTMAPKILGGDKYTTRQIAVKQGEPETEARIQQWEQLVQETASTAAIIAAGLDLPNHIQDSFVIGERSGEIDEDALFMLFDEDEDDPRIFMQREARSIPKIAIAFVLDLSSSMLLPSWVRPEHLTGRDAQKKMRDLMKYTTGGRRIDEARALLCATMAAMKTKGINDIHVYGYEDEDTNIHHIVTPEEGEGDLWRISCADPYGGTRTPEAITYASRQIEKHHPDHPIKLVIVLSDGEDILSKGAILGSAEKGFTLGDVRENTRPDQSDVKRNYISPTQGTTANYVRRGGKNLIQKFIEGTDILELFEDDQDPRKDENGELFVTPNQWIYAACRESELTRNIPVCGIAIFSGIGPNTVACAYGPGRGVSVNDAATAAPVISSFLSRVMRDHQ